METIQSQGLTKQEYIKYVYGDNASKIADAFYDNAIVNVYNPYRNFTISICSEFALWLYFDSMYSMRNINYTNYSVC